MRFLKVSVSFRNWVLLIIFAGCKGGKKNELTGEWYINPYHEEYLLEAADEYTILRLYPEGIFTQFGESGYCTGTWKRNVKGNYLNLIRQEGTLPLVSEFLKIEMLEPDKMTVDVYDDLSFEKKGRQTVMQLLKRVNKSDEDPYLPDLQTWRIKPKEPEPETAIRKRVTNYLEFLHSKYKHAVDNDIQTAHNWYPSPLRMDYGGGCGWLILQR